MDGPPFVRCSHELHYHIPVSLTLSGTVGRSLIASAHLSTKEVPGGKCIACAIVRDSARGRAGQGKVRLRQHVPQPQVSHFIRRLFGIDRVGWRSKEPVPNLRSAWAWKSVISTQSFVRGISDYDEPGVPGEPVAIP